MNFFKLNILPKLLVIWHFLKILLKIKIYLPLVLVLIIIGFFGGNYLAQNDHQSSKVAIFNTQIVSDFKINLNQAEATNVIRVSGQAAPSPDGKKFLVISSDIENSSTSARLVSYGDLFRLEEDGKRLAPLPININFTIPPKSTLEKQLVFIVNKDNKYFNLFVGTLDKEPETVQIKLK